MKKFILSISVLLSVLVSFSQTIALDVQKRWDAGDRTVGGALNMNPSGLCPPGRGVLETPFDLETWLNMTCAQSDPVTGSNKRTEGKFGFDGDTRIANNQFYYIETYFEDYAPDGTSPNSTNHLFFQWKFGADYPQFATWVINSGGVLKFQAVRQWSATTGITSPQNQSTNIIANLLNNQKIVWGFDIGWAGDNTGHIKIYLNGSVVLNLTGIQTMDGGSTTPPFRFGPYCFGGFNSILERTIYYRRIVIGNNDFASYEEFEAAINPSTPLPPTTGGTNTNEIPGIYINL